MYKKLIVDGGQARGLWEVCGDRWLGVFLGKIAKIRKEYNVKNTVVAWDHPNGSSSRKKIYPSYKANRPRPIEFIDSINDAKKVLPQFGVTQAESEFGEADDVIATMVRQSTGSIVWTNDKDLLQLVYACDVLWGKRRPNPDILVNFFNIEKITGLACSDIVPWLILGGDSVDGIKGVKRCGDKSARRIINACPDIIQLVTDGNFEKIRAAKNKDARIGTLIERVIKSKNDIEIMLRLVMLQSVNFDLRPPREDWSDNCNISLCENLGAPWLHREWMV